MAVTSVSVILTVCVLKLHHCGPHQKEVPPWIRFVVLKVMGQAFNCQCRNLAPRRIRKPNKMKDKHRKKIKHENAEVCLRLVHECNINKHSPVAEFRMNSTSKPINRQDSLNDLSANTNVDERPEFKRLSAMEEILKYLKVMVAKRDEDDMENEIVNEWRQVAAVMDRVLFWMFLITTTVATIVMMVLIPLLRVYDYASMDVTPGPDV